MSTSRTVNASPNAPIITAWQSEPVTITAVTTNPTKGTIVNDKIWWRRVGDSMEIRVDYEQSSAGTAGSGTYFIGVPAGYSIDSLKCRLYSANASGVAQIGQGSITDEATYVNAMRVYPYSATKFRLEAIGAGYVSNSVAHMGTTLYAIAFIVTVPIAGWG